MVVRPGDQVDRDELVARLVAGGYRREYQVEARGEVAVRGSIVDVYPSTDDHPVRIDLWGDEVDRLSAFSVADQRSTHDVAEACIFPTRELLPTDDVRARAAALVAQQPWGASSGSASPRASCSTAWSRGCRGSPTASTCSPTSCRTTRWCCSSSRSACATAPRSCSTKRRRWRRRSRSRGARASERDLPRLSLEFDRLLAHTGAGAVSLLVDARRSRHAARRGQRVRPRRRRRRRARPSPARARGRGLPRRARRGRHRFRAASARHPRRRGSRRRRGGTGARRGAPARRAARTRCRATRRAPRARRRGRPHRSSARAPPARAARAAARTTTTTSKPATTSCTTSTASAGTSR